MTSPSPPPQPERPSLTPSELDDHDAHGNGQHQKDCFLHTTSFLG